MYYQSQAFYMGEQHVHFLHRHRRVASNNDKGDDDGALPLLPVTKIVSLPKSVSLLREPCFSNGIISCFVAPHP